MCPNCNAHCCSKRQDWELTAAAMEVLVPIRIDVDLEHLKYRDVFTWNLNGTATGECARRARGSGVRLCQSI